MPPNPIAAALDGLLPVEFDPEAADHLILALRDLHGQAVAAYRADGEASNAARAEWRGFTRRWFEDRHAALHHDLLQLGIDARSLAEEVRRAKHAATVLQAEHDERVRAALARVAAVEGVEP